MDIASSGFLTKLLEVFQEKCATGIENLTPEALAIAMALGIIEIAISGMFNWGTIRIQEWVSKVLKIGFFIFLVFNWQDLTMMVFDSFKAAGLIASGTTMLIDPSSVVDKGLFLVTDIWDSIFSKSGMGTVLGSLGIIILSLLLSLVIVFCFGFMAIQIVLTFIEFYILTALSIILLPFGISRYTSFLSEKVIGAVFSSGIKLMVLTFLLGIGVPLLKGDAIPAGDDFAPMVQCAITALTFAFLTIQLPAIAQSLLSGNPSLDAGSAMNSARSGMAMATGFIGGSMATLARGGKKLQYEGGMVRAAAMGASGTGSIGGAMAHTASRYSQLNAQRIANGISSTKENLFSSYNQGKEEGSNIFQKKADAKADANVLNKE